VPFLLQAPWIVLVGLLPPLEDSRAHLLRITILTSLVAIGETVTALLVQGMLRFRARSVFNTPAEVHPEPALKCYARSAARLPQLYATEVLRYLALILAWLIVFPGLYLSFKLSMATESVVLQPASPVGAFKRSFHLTEGRWERWLEMIAITASMVLGLLFLLVVGFLSVPGSSWNAWVAAGMFMSAAILPVIQYAWTFFYLRLEESDAAALASEAVVTPRAEIAAGPWRSGTAPKLKLVEVEREKDDAGN
jgi:hypothetical protein